MQPDSNPTWPPSEWKQQGSSGTLSQCTTTLERGELDALKSIPLMTVDELSLPTEPIEEDASFKETVWDSMDVSGFSSVESQETSVVPWSIEPAPLLEPINSTTCIVQPFVVDADRKRPLGETLVDVPVSKKLRSSSIESHKDTVIESIETHPFVKSVNAVRSKRTRSGHPTVEASELKSSKPIKEHHRILKALYSGIEVYEMSVNGIHIMRRASDDHVNATQILKLAGLSKPQRTAVMLKEILHLDHEKVQGGYGKYQGTWVNLELGKELAYKYGVGELIKDMLDLNPETDVILSKRSYSEAKIAQEAKERLQEKVPSQPTTRSRRLSRKSKLESTVETMSESQEIKPAELKPAVETVETNAHQPIYPTPAHTPSASSVVSCFSSGYSPNSTLPVFQLIQIDEDAPPPPSAIPVGDLALTHPDELELHLQLQEQQDILLNLYTLDDASFVISLVAHRICLYSSMYDPSYWGILSHTVASKLASLHLDGNENTLLHWAATYGRVNVLSTMLQVYQSNPLVFNAHGYHPLISAVRHVANYEQQSFPQILKVLNPLLNHADSQEQKTVLHHIIELGSQRGKVMASRYYLGCFQEWAEQCVLPGESLDLQYEEVLTDEQEGEPKRRLRTRSSRKAESLPLEAVQDGFYAELPRVSRNDFLHFLHQPDGLGNTVLHLACKQGDPVLIAMLMEMGCQWNCKNAIGQTPQHFMCEHPRLADYLRNMLQDGNDLDRIQLEAAILKERGHEWYQVRQAANTIVTLMSGGWKEEEGILLKDYTHNEE